MTVGEFCTIAKAYAKRPGLRGPMNIGKGVEALTQGMDMSVNISDYDQFFSPIKIRIFKLDKIMKIKARMAKSYGGSWSNEATECDVYVTCTLIVYVLRLIRLAEEVKRQIGGDSLISLGITQSVVSKLVDLETWLDVDDEAVKATSGTFKPYNYITLALRRIISMEVGTDDWAK